MMKETMLDKSTDAVCITCHETIPDPRVHLMQTRNRGHVIIRWTHTVEKVENA